MCRIKQNVVFRRERNNFFFRRVYERTFGLLKMISMKIICDSVTGVWFDPFLTLEIEHLFAHVPIRQCEPMVNILFVLDLHFDFRYPAYGMHV